MHFKTDEEPGRKTKEYTGSTYTLDLVTRGGMSAPARELYIPTGGDGTLFVRHKDDWSEEELEVLGGETLTGYYAEIAFGDVATYPGEGGAGSYPVVLTGAESLTIKLDESTDHDTQNIVITPPAGSYTQAQLLAYLNQELNDWPALAPPGGHPDVAYAVDTGGGDSSLSSRSRGTAAAVRIVAIHATLATGLDWAVSLTNGAAFASPATAVRVIW